MKKNFLALSLALTCAVAVQAQSAQTTATGNASTQASAATKNVTLNSGTQLAGQLQNSIDVRNAKVGDQVLLKTTKAIKSEGRTVVAKGARLIGHVTEVAQKTKGSGVSRVGILFDRLEQGNLELPIVASITSITSGHAGARASSDDGFMETGAGGSARSTTATSSGGLLGGATNTVGNVVGGTTSAVGSTVNSTTNAVGSTTSGVGRTLSGIQISQSSGASVEGSSTLSLQGGNLRLEKGTNFNLVLTQSASVGGRNE